jgi:hypothetical protein
VSCLWEFVAKSKIIVIKQKGKSMTEEKLNAVRNYLSAEFPDYAIHDLYESSREAQTFHLTTKDEINLVTVSREFFEDYSSSKIIEVLERSNLSQYFQQKDIARIIVTSSGIVVEERLQ